MKREKQRSAPSAARRRCTGQREAKQDPRIPWLEAKAGPRAGREGSHQQHREQETSHEKTWMSLGPGKKSRGEIQSRRGQV